MPDENQFYPVEMLPIDELIPADYNPRAITEDNLEALKAGVEELGWLGPVVVHKRTDGEKRIVGGHQRVLAARDLGVTQMQCVVVTGLSDAQEKLANVTLNNPHAQGEWDTTLVNLMAEIQQEVDPDLYAGMNLGELAATADLVVPKDFLDNLDAQAASEGDGQGAPDEEHDPPPVEGEADADGKGMIQFTVPLSEVQLSTVRQAIRAARDTDPDLSTAGALALVCNTYLMPQEQAT